MEVMAETESTFQILPFAGSLFLRNQTEKPNPWFVFSFLERTHQDSSRIYSYFLRLDRILIRFMKHGKTHFLKHSCYLPTSDANYCDNDVTARSRTPLLNHTSSYPGMDWLVRHLRLGFA